VERKPKFVPYVDAAGAHRWRLVDTNGRIIADGAEGYVDRHGVERAIDNVRQAAAVAAVDGEA
jgi:uncharacterized protein YegP (UPF0339 family)